MSRNNPVIASLAAVLVMLGVAPAHAMGPGESVTLDPATGNYVITYIGENGEALRSVFEPNTKIDPFVASFFEHTTDGAIRYSYSIASGAGSRQSIAIFSLDYARNIRARRELNRTLNDRNVDKAINLDRLQACIEALRRPPDWDGGCAVTRRHTPPGVQLSWRNARVGIPVGAKLTGLGFDSSELPGMVASRLRGDSYPSWKSGRDPSPNDFEAYELSDELDRELTALSRKDMDGVVRWAASPFFQVRDPFNGLALVESLREHVTNWPAQQLMDQSFWNTIDGFLGAAIASLKKNDVVNAIANLAQVRIELRKKYLDLDATTLVDDPTIAALPKVSLSGHDQRLAGKVLDFDADFVIRRLQVQNSATPSAPDSDGPGIPMPPSSNSMYAPLADLNGTFTISWSTPLLVTWIGSATVSKLDHYELQYSIFSDFRNATKINAGRELSYQIRNLAPGKYFTRVIPWIGRADNCQGCVGGGSGDEVYDAAPKEPYAGPHQTDVLVGP